MKLGPNRWMAAGLALAVGIGVVTLTGQLVKQAGDPAPVVQEYLAAIASGDATTANEMLDFETPEGERLEDAEGALLSDDVLGAASERITVHRVETVERSKDSARVRAELSLAGETFEHDFVLEGEHGSIFARDQWRLTSPLIGLTVVTLPSETNVLPEGLSLDIGAAELAIEHSALGLGEPFAAAVLYPAVYPVSLSAGEYFDPQRGEMVVKPVSASSRERLNSLAIGSMFGSIEDPDLVLPIELSEKFTDAMVQSGLAFAQACVAEPGVAARIATDPTTCPQLTNSAAVDTCEANPDSRLGTYDGLSFLCEFYRGIAPFRGSIEVTAPAASVVPEEGSNGRFEIGPYRFTEVQSGRSFDMPLRFALLEWHDGSPTVTSGDFWNEE